MSELRNTLTTETWATAWAEPSMSPTPCSPAALHPLPLGSGETSQMSCSSNPGIFLSLLGQMSHCKASR